SNMVLVSLVLSHMLVMTLAQAERLCHNRDCSNLQYHSQSEVNPILSPQSAKQFLTRYGWIKPVNWESLQRHRAAVPQEESPDSPENPPQDVPDNSGSSSAEDSAPTETVPESSFLQALEHFQQANNLPVTGALDEPTQKTMTRPRCGVPDYKSPHGIQDPEDTPRARSNSTVSNSSAEAAPHNDGSPTDASSSGTRAGRPREKRFLQQLVERSQKQRRSVVYVRSSDWGMGFSKRALKWRLLGEGYSSWLPIEDQRKILKRAFRLWSEVIPLNFQEDLTSRASEIDVKLGFGTRRHLGCSQAFDGAGQELAHAWHLGDIHFNDDKHFVPPRSEQGINLLTVAVHEIGHVLGLPHISRVGSVMQASYNSQNAYLELDRKDRNAIQGIYGTCGQQFGTVFDMVYKGEDEEGHVKYKFSTYFFRSSWYWRYENQYSRPRYRDPILLRVGWHGIPSEGIDACVHVWTTDKDSVLFFKGTQFWQYDTENDRACTEDSQGRPFPQLIKDRFPGVPSPIDTAFFDRRDHNIFFFRGNNVTAFNVDLNRKVDGYPKRIIDVFPAVVSGDHPVGNLDAVYFSYYYNATYIFKDQDYWKVVDERDRKSNSSLPYNGLFPHHSISSQWLDICDVHPSMLSPD
uniref:Matrix metalloproteinase-21-like n=1 Tax=Lepisosteus oculatus TaxID=7918 RepID=W5M1S6_LEPOC